MISTGICRDPLERRGPQSEARVLYLRNQVRNLPRPHPNRVADPNPADVETPALCPTTFDHVESTELRPLDGGVPAARTRPVSGRRVPRTTGGVRGSAPRGASATSGAPLTPAPRHRSQEHTARAPTRIVVFCSHCCTLSGRFCVQRQNPPVRLSPSGALLALVGLAKRAARFTPVLVGHGMLRNTRERMKLDEERSQAGW